MMPVTSTASPNSLAWRSAVLARRGVDGHQRLVRRVGHLLGDHAADLLSSAIRSSLGVQAPGGVDDHDVGAALAPAGDGVEGDRAGVGALGALDDVDARALAPALELLDRGGAERVGGADHDGLAERVACRCQASLPIVVVLPVPLTPTTRITVGFGADVDRVVAGAGELREQLGEPLGQLLAADEAALLRLALELLDDLRGRAGADVGVDQRLLEPLPGLLVEVALEQRRLDLGGERLARLAHVLAQAAEEAAALLGASASACGGRGHGAVGEEEVGPVAGHRRGRIERVAVDAWLAPCAGVQLGASERRACTAVGSRPRCFEGSIVHA